MKRSLTLCASMLLLAPLSLALGMESAEFSVNLGHRTVAIGDRTSATIGLLGDAKGTGALGTTTALVHSTPAVILGGSFLIPMGNSTGGVKLAIEAQVSKTDKHKLYNGQSKTATVTLKSLPGTVDSATGAAAGKYGVYSITGGKREATVEHQAAYGGKVLYAFGENNHNIGVGLGVLWTNDDYKYVVEEAPTAAANSGVITDANITAVSFPNGFTATIPQVPALVAGDIATGLYTPVLGTEEKYGDRMFWYGLCTETASKLGDKVSVKAGLSYYRRQFEISKSFTTSAPFVQTATDASMYVGHIGVSYCN